MTRSFVLCINTCWPYRVLLLKRLRRRSHSMFAVKGQRREGRRFRDVEGYSQSLGAESHSVLSRNGTGMFAAGSCKNKFSTEIWKSSYTYLGFTTLRRSWWAESDVPLLFSASWYSPVLNCRRRTLVANAPEISGNPLFLATTLFRLKFEKALCDVEIVRRCIMFFFTRRLSSPGPELSDQRVKTHDASYI